MSRRILAALTGALLLSACNATSNTSFRARNFTADRDSAILIDAKQRAILTRVWQENGEDPAKVRRFCSEPSPDFVSVMAQALSAGGTFGKTADPTSLQVALNLAYSRSENGTTIARTQTINMLRELMFRTCERFLSGGYDEMELSIQAVRDQRLMVSILAIEQLTGAVAPSPVVISTEGSAGAGLSGKAIETYDKLREEKKKAEAAEKTAQEAHDKDWKAKADGSDNVCTVNAGKFGDGKTPSDDDKKEMERCEGLKTSLASAKAAAAEATKAFTTVEQAISTGGVSVSTVSEAIASGGLNRATSDATKEVAGTVLEIVELNFNDQTETMLYCMKALKEDYPELSSAQREQLVERCLSYLDQRIATDQAKQVLVAQAVEVEMAALDGDFAKFWPNVRRADETLDRAKLDALASTLNPAPVGRDVQILKQRLSDGLSKDSARAIFGQLSSRVRDHLSQ
jgi:hypothetical protein